MSSVPPKRTAWPAGSTSLRCTSAAGSGEYRAFTRKLRQATGLDLGVYKSQQLERRLRLFMGSRKAEGFVDYLRLLESDPDQLAALQGFVSVCVSEFFRSPELFEYLREEALPSLLQRRATLRLWSAGCSFGAEAFSLALLLEELTPGQLHYILGSDVQEAAIERAHRAADFTAEELRHVPERLLQRFFLPNDVSSPGAGRQAVRFALDPDVRRRVTFRRHDLLSDPFEGDFDLIICRNVMIYLTDDAKARLCQSLYHAMRPGGYLVTGSVEALDALSVAGFSRLAAGVYRKVVEG